MTPTKLKDDSRFEDPDKMTPVTWICFGTNLWAIGKWTRCFIHLLAVERFRKSERL